MLNDEAGKEVMDALAGRATYKAAISRLEALTDEQLTDFLDAWTIEGLRNVLVGAPALRKRCAALLIHRWLDNAKKLGTI